MLRHQREGRLSGNERERRVAPAKHAASVMANVRGNTRTRREYVRLACGAYSHLGVACEAVALASWRRA